MLPRYLTSYDLLKSLALLLMVVDHVGYFFYPEYSWFRVVGRLSVPIWFFLIGYADTRKVQPEIWFGGVIVTFSAVMAGEYLFPMSILFTLAFSRLWIDRLMAGALQSYQAFAGMFCLLFFLSLPTLIGVEYGTLGMFFTVFGFLRKNKDGITMNRFALFGFLFAVYLLYVVVSGLLIPHLGYDQMFFMMIGMFFVMLVLFFFRSQTYPDLTAKAGRVFAPIMFMGRHTLGIYVLHLVVFRMIILVVGDERFGFFDFEILPPAFARILQAFFG